MFNSFILIVKKKNTRIMKLDELIFMVMRSSLDGAISFKLTYHGESIGLVAKQ